MKGELSENRHLCIYSQRINYGNFTNKSIMLKLNKITIESQPKYPFKIVVNFNLHRMIYLIQKSHQLHNTFSIVGQTN
jgi:hypothetical protein